MAESQRLTVAAVQQYLPRLEEALSKADWGRLEAILVQRFVSPYQVKPSVDDKAVANRVAVRIA